MDRRYFEEEMRYLHQAGRAFAEAHPEEARYLNTDSVAERDPYVERLFEGFAFLTGRIREQLDDEMPRYTEGLFELLFPHFLRPVPSCTILELAPRPGLVQEATTLARGFEVRSDPAGPERAACRFRTTQPVRLRPLRLIRAAIEEGGPITSRLRLRFEGERGVDLRALDLSPLRLYLHAEPAVAVTLYRFLTHHVRRVSLEAAGTPVGTLFGQQAIRPVGFAADEALLPYDARSFAGYRLLHEYLSFRRKFWFVDLTGLDGEALPDQATSFDVVVCFDRTYPADRRFGSDNLRLHCTPAVNLFEVDTEPVRVTGERAEYRIVPDVRFRRSVEAVDLLEVLGTEDDTGVQRAYTPYHTFAHGPAGPGRRSGSRPFTLARRPGPTGLTELFMTVPDAAEGGRAETLSMRALCTNGSVPREFLREGTVRHLGPGVPQIVRPTNLTQPTATLRPPSRRGDDYFWELLSHWSLNLQSVARPDGLRELLRLYDWTDTDANAQRARAISDVRWRPKEVLQHGSALRGMEVTIEVQEESIPDAGELILFGEVLSAFLSLYATINAFVHLVIVTRPSEQRYTWQPVRGGRPVV